MSLTPGTRFGAYEVVALLGAGGMGEVYRAHDSRLGRDVAIKILAHEFTNDPERRRRFDREARMLASLNHPHIGAIYGIEEAVEHGDAVGALILELVEGDTLCERIRRGPLPIAEALSVAHQIADALDAAHDKGIVHRDLKPANIKMRPDGTVKVLDFGLSKVYTPAEAGALTDSEGKDFSPANSPTITSPPMTRAGFILGTAAYMSPEQARGKTVDRRTDVWALGCVLYESLTGRPAFPGDTVSDLIAAIIGQDPDWSALPSETPATIRRLLRRCLVKDPSKRLRDIGDARLELEDAIAKHESERGNLDAVATAHVRSRIPWWVWASGLALVAAAGLTGWALRGRIASTDENPLAGAHFTRLTDFAGTVRDPALSPDGRFAAFLSNRSGVFDVWLTQVGSGTFTNLTNGTEPNLDSPIRVIGFANHGSHLWLSDSDVMGPLRLMPLFGGPPRVFLNRTPAKTPPRNAAWSHDSTRVVYHTSDPGDPMFVTDGSGANARQIFVDPNPGMHNHSPIWSPDGRWIYFLRGNPAARVLDLWRIRESGGEPERLTHHNDWVAHPTPVGTEIVMYVARDRDGSGPWLWALDVSRNKTRRVSFGLEQYTAISSSADGRRLVAATANPIEGLWSVPILDRVADERDVAPYPLPTVRALAPRFRGSSLFYLSSRGAGAGLWRYQNGQAREIWRGADGALLSPAAVSFDESRVAFGLRRDGALRLHVLGADGGDLQPMAANVEVRGDIAWSPDGRWIATAGRDDSIGDGIFKIPVAGGPGVRLVSGLVHDPVWSPDGTFIVYTGVQVGLYAPLLAVRPDGSPLELPEIQLRREGERVRFSPDGKSLIYMQGQLASQDFWQLDLATKQMRRLTRLTDVSIMRSFDITPDGKQIVFDRERENSELVLIDLPRR